MAARLSPLDTGWPAVVAGSRPAAVLVLLSDAADPDLVLTVRSPALSHQPGQMALPGGGREPGDVSPAATAIRETTEEIGLTAQHIRPLGQLPMRGLPINRNQVIPVVGWWPDRVGLGPIDSGEVAGVVRWPISWLADPAHRLTARHPRGSSGPAWQAGELFLWGLTAGIVDTLLRLGGWDQPWDTSRVVEVPAEFRRNTQASPPSA